jgi:hypothetical protein
MMLQLYDILKSAGQFITYIDPIYGSDELTSAPSSITRLPQLRAELVVHFTSNLSKYHRSDVV